MKQRQEHKGTNSQSNPNRDEVIQQRAYELYTQRGQEPGHEMEDWLQAEREIISNGGRTGQAQDSRTRARA